MSSVSKQNTEKLEAILREYSGLPEYSGLGVPEIDTKSLFGDYPINIAATRGLINEVSTLLDSRADVDTRGEHGYTPLHNSVEQGHMDTVKFLVDHGASMTIHNADGYTPIELAKLLGENEIYRFLREENK